jgi:hypothetical protein
MALEHASVEACSRRTWDRIDTVLPLARDFAFLLGRRDALDTNESNAS